MGLGGRVRFGIVFTQVISQIYVPDEESASSGMSWFIAFAKPLLSIRAWIAWSADLSNAVGPQLYCGEKF